MQKKPRPKGGPMVKRKFKVTISADMEGYKLFRVLIGLAY